MKLNHIFYFLVVILLSLCGMLLSYAISDRRPLFYVIEGVIFLAVVFLIVFYRRVVRPIRYMADGVDMLRGQDFSSRLRKVGQYETDKIIDVFNPMMAQLKQERLRLREQNRILDLLLDASPLGVVAINSSGEVTVSNPAAMKIFGVDSMGKRLADIRHPIVATLMNLREGQTEVLRMSSADIYRCQRVSFMNDGYAHPFFIIEILTAEMMAAEKAAYEKAIRMIVHEVNNTLGGVDATLHAFSGVWDADSPEEAVIATCLQRTQQLGSFISRFASAAKIPAPEFVESDLVAFIESNRYFLESLCVAAGVRFEVLIGSDKDFIAGFDPVLMEQVLVNVVKNSVESILAVGRTDGLVTISINPEERTLTVTDNGGGITPEVSKHLFTPFFSTKPGGQGIGMIFIADILKKHRYKFSLSTSEVDRLTRFVIKF